MNVEEQKYMDLYVKVEISAQFINFTFQCLSTHATYT